MSGTDNNNSNANTNKTTNNSKITNIIRSPLLSKISGSPGTSFKPLPPTPTKQTTELLPLKTEQLPQQQQTSSISRSNLVSIANRERDATQVRSIKNQNRHTIAISVNEDFENVYPSNSKKVIDELTVNFKDRDLPKNAAKSPIQITQNEKSSPQASVVKIFFIT